LFISRLEMHGFKSFAARTVMEFRPGVMAVVGPNGCGKTNIVDAIRWVLGEQRTGILRADRMEAVIFTGTSKRKPLGMGEVTLTIENNRGMLPAIYSEVAITRRLFRSGESEYLINRNTARLRDIADLFTDTGFGSNAYSIIELAMVEGIISGPTSARRFLFEEAAGVSRYKARRQAAEKRLQTTKEDLLRIEDIYQEVEKSFHNLKRQASRARRYQELEKAIRCRVIADLADERLDILRRREPLEAKLAELEAEREQAEADATRATTDLLSQEGRELSLIDRTNRTQETLKRIDRREAELEGEAALINQRIAFLENERTQSDQRRAELHDAVIRNEELRQKSLRETTESQGKLTETTRSRDALAAEMRALEGALEKLAGLLTTAEERETKAENTLEEARESASSEDDTRRDLVAQQSRLEREIAQLNKEIAGLESALKSADKAAADSARAAEEAASSRVKLVKELDSLRHRQSDALASEARARADCEAAQAALQAHRSLASERRLPKAVQSVVEKEKLRILAARLKCQPEHRTALAAALKPVLGALDRPDWDSVAGLAKQVEAGAHSVLRFPITGVAARKMFASPAPDCHWGAELVGNDGSLGDFLCSRLSDVVLVPGWSELAKWADWARKNNVRLVTSDGVLLEPDGVLFVGGSDPDALQVGWESRERELEKRLKDAETAQTKTASERQSNAAALKAGESELAKAEAAYRRAGDDAARAERQRDGARDNLERIQHRVSGATRELERVSGELESTADTGTETPDLTGLEDELEEARAERAKLDGELRKLERQRLGLSQSSSAVNAEIATLTERLSASERDAERGERELKNAQDALGTLEARLAEGSGELERTRQSVENNTAQLELIAREKRDVTATMDATRSERLTLKHDRDAATVRLNEAQARQKASYADRSRVESEAISLRERLREVDRRLIEDAAFQPTDVDEGTAIEMIAALADLELADLPAEKLKLRLQSLGPVNMLALEELKEVESRYKFLADQKQDLQKGIDVLAETIDRINSEARRLFRETFDQINLNFQETFRILFEGGEARIALEEGDPLEADIRIWATPSGKKLQSLSVLSGGEKALTAVALLFSIYRARPTPFCILDEVDAPLDDTNVVRFNKLIHQHTRDTQFLIVTHNKRTMEAADCLYGVTLDEDGCSQIVSVKFEGGREAAMEETDESLLKT